MKLSENTVSLKRSDELWHHNNAVYSALMFLPMFNLICICSFIWNGLLTQYTNVKNIHTCIHWNIHIHHTHKIIIGSSRYHIFSAPHTWNLNSFNELKYKSRFLMRKAVVKKACNLSITEFLKISFTSWILHIQQLTYLNH